jgi:hypothetical protein
MGQGRGLKIRRALEFAGSKTEVVAIRVGRFAHAGGGPMVGEELMGRRVVADVFEHPTTDLGTVAAQARASRLRQSGEHRFYVRLPAAAIDVAEFECGWILFMECRAVRTVDHSRTQRDLEYSISMW